MTDRPDDQDLLGPVREAMANAQDIEVAPDAPHPDPDAGGAAPPGDGLSDEMIEKLRAGAGFPLNDTGNGRRFADYCAGMARYVPRMGWHIWDARRWRLDPDGIAVQALGQTIQERIMEEVPFLALTGKEQAAEARLEQVRAALRTLPEDMAAASEEERTEARTKLTREKDELTAFLWGKSSTRARHLTHAKNAGNSGPIKNMLAEAVPRMHIDVEDMDADPLTVNTLSGLLRFRRVDTRAEGGGLTAELQVEDHQRLAPITDRNARQYITKLMPAEYDPDATCPQFDAFLTRVQPDAAMRDFLARWFGLSMTGLKVQKFLYCYGQGANGKSVLANVMRRMMGDYATMVKIESLIGQNRKSGSDATPDLFRLIGARAAITSEPPEGERMQEGKLKEMTGGEEMLVRTLHADFVEFTPYFKLTFTANHKLEIRGTDDGIWRRPLLCPFEVQIPEGERDEGFADRLFEQERSGILNWMIAGLMDYLEGGLQEPDQVLQATENYRKDSDPIGDFLATGCEIDGGSEFLAARDLVEACYLYLLENTSHAWQPGNLQRKLKERAEKYVHPASGRSYVRHKRNGTWGYSGIRLTEIMAERLRAAPRDAKGLPMLRKVEGGQDSRGEEYDW